MKILRNSLISTVKYYSTEDFKALSCKSDFSFFHLNISSLSKHLSDLSALSTLLEHSFDIMGITEIRLNSSSSGNIDLPNYSFLHTPSETSVGGAGIYISKKLTFVPRTDFSTLLYSSGSLESVFCELKLKNKKNIIVGCIYRHPSMDIDVFNDSFLSPFLNKEEKISCLSC